MSKQRRTEEGNTTLVIGRVSDIGVTQSERLLTGVFLVVCVFPSKEITLKDGHFITRENRNPGCPLKTIDKMSFLEGQVFCI